MKNRIPLAAAVMLFAACDKPAPPPADMATTTPPAATTPTISAAPAPAVFRVRMETSEGPLVIEAHRDWSPNGVDRFFELVEANYFDDVRFFRVVPGFIVQFGMHGNPATNTQWQDRKLHDDSVKQTNRRGTVTFAQTPMPNTRSTQLFINLRDNAFLDPQRFSPIGEVVEGMSVVDALYGGYGDNMNQDSIAAEGNAFLNRQYPKLDFIRTARIVK